MAAIDDLIKQIDDPGLRARIAQEFHKVSKKKKFGLVFEEHLPEATPLYDIPIKQGALVAEKQGEISDIYVVTSIDAETNTVTCVNKESNEECQFQSDDLVTVAQFGDPIYPYLKPIDTVCNAPDSDLWHTLIEADNYHALQLLEYLYAGKVDCIYIDPPYNTGAKDWKYNNDYVDSNDSYRHSKWLSFMERRLKLAKKLLNPKESVLIVTIDEKEYLHLGCLLEEMFTGSYLQMVSTIINPKGVSSLQGFKKADEYIFFVMLGNASPVALPLGNEWSPSAIKSASNNDDSKNNGPKEPGWTSMMRRGSHSSRSERPGLYYAIYADPTLHKIVKVGDVMPQTQSRDVEIEGLVQILPLRTNGDEGCWQVGPQELNNRISQGRIRLGRATDYGFVVNYLPDGEYQKVLDGLYEISGFAEDGSMIAYKKEDAGEAAWVAPTQWKIASHDASAYGSTLLSNILCGKKFAFPKSLYAVQDTLRFFVENKPDALIVDFFAGSGTTLHAINLLNAADGGHRRTILVTNNEVSVDEAKTLNEKGYKPGDNVWENLGIARYVTWPRTVCSINGHDINGNPLKGNYLGNDIPMSDGFNANAAFFRLGFLDKTQIALGRQFREMLPTLWMKNDCVGPCPALKKDDVIPDMMILHENRMAILIDERAYSEFKDKVNQATDINMVFIITDSEDGYREMANGLHVTETCQLYRDYLDNFRINVARR